MERAGDRRQAADSATRRRYAQICALACLLTATATWAVPPEGGKKARPAKLEATRFAIKTTEPVDVILLEHTGPYWTIGPVVEQVASYQRTHGVQGSLFIRQLDDVAVTSPSALRSQVGIILSEPHEPADPFTRDRWVATDTAYQTVKQVRVSARRQRAAIRAWARSQGRQVTAVTTEIYPPFSSEAGLVSTGQRGIELRVDLVPTVDTEPLADQSDGLKKLTPGRARIRLSRRPESQRGLTLPSRPEKSVEVGANPTTVDAEIVTRDEVPTSTPSPAEAAVDAAGTVAMEATEPADVKPLTLPSRPEAPALQASPVPVVEAGEPRVSTESAGPVDEDNHEAKTISELVGEEAWAQVAQRVLPTDATMTLAMEVWLGQVVFRVGAIAKGIERVYPDRAGRVTDLSAALTGRYRDRPSAGDIDPLDQPVVRVDVHGDPTAERKRLAMRSLDRLMGQLAIRAVSADVAFHTVVKVLEDVEALVIESQIPTLDAPESNM